MWLRLASYLVALGVMALLGIFVYANNTKGRVNRSFFLFTLAANLWIFSLALADNTKSLALVEFGARLAFVSSIASLFMVVVFTLQMANPSRKNRNVILAYLIPAAALAVTAPTKLSVASVSIESYGAGVQGGITYDLLSIYAAVCLASGIFILIRGIRKRRGLIKTQLRYLLLGLSLTGIIAALTNLVFVSYGYLGPPSYLFLAGSTAYAVIRHRLFNIRAVVARSVAYLLLLLTLGALYGAGIFGVSSLFFPDSTNPLAQNVLYVTLALILAFTFQPLRRFFEHLTDNLLYRDRYDSQEVLNEISNVLITEFNLEKILQESLRRLCQRLSLESGQFYIFNDDRIYRLEHYGPIPQKLMVAPELIHLKKSLLIADELEGGMAKELMDAHGVRMAMRLTTHDRFVGFLLLGDKLSGDIYTPQDIELLQIAAKEIAVAVTNAMAYEQIQQFNVTLQEKVEEATHRLQLANRHLRELDEAKDEFISMASHQLRTPLTSIKGYVSMLIEGDAGKLDAQQKEFLQYAYSGTNRMVALISDLLNVSRMQAGRFLIERAPVDLTAVAAEEVNNLQAHAAPKNLKLEFIPPKTKLPLVSIDENKTRQVIMNFVDNAIYYTKQGSVTVSLEKKGEAVELRVKDTGIGVPKDAQKKLFHKFYRADNAQSVRPDGTGLGLFLAKRVIEDQGGSIIFETEENKGSTFGFSLPLAAVKVKAGEAKAQPQVKVR